MSSESARELLERIGRNKQETRKEDKSKRAYELLKKHGKDIPRLRLQELPELTAAPSPYASWTGKKGGVDARGVDLEAGAADLESRGKGLGVLDEYIRAAEANLGKLERRALLTGAQEDLDAWQAAFEPYKAVVDRYNSETENFERLRGIYNEEAKLSGMDEAGLQKTIDENVRRLEKEADPQKISELNRENERARRRMSEMQQAAEARAARLEGAYAREDELVRGIAKAERGLRRTGDVTELRRMQSELEDVRAQITELGGKADASWLKGAGQQYLGTMQQAAGILVKGDDNRQRESNIRAGEEALAEALEAAIMAEAAGRGDRAETERLRGIVDAIGKPGADKEALLAEFLPGIAEVTEDVEKRNEFAEAGRQAMQEEGAERAAKGAENIEAAKGGKNAAEKILIDVGVQGVNMALDAAIGSVTMLGGNVPLAIRSFGGAAGQASEAGASDARAIGYGVASAAAEVLFGKLTDGAAGIYGKGTADDFVDHLVGKIAKTDTGRKAWQLLFASAGEGAEEVITALVDPALQLIYNGKSLGESYSELEGAEVAYDFMIGAIMGFFGGGIDAVKEPGASTQFFYDAAQNGMSFPQAVSAWKTLSKDIMKTETDRAKKLAGIDAMADRIVAQQARSRMDAEKAAARKEADREYFEKYTTRAQANKIVNDEALKAEWQKKTGVTLEGPKGEQARMVMDESRKKLDELEGVGVAENATATEAATVSETEEVGESGTAAQAPTVTETTQGAPERAQNTVEVQTGTETGKQRNVPTAAQAAQSWGNDAKSAQQTIEILRGRDTDTARYGGVEYSVFYEADGTYTARAVRGDETIWTQSGLKNRTEAVNAMQSAREAGKIAGSETAGAPGLVKNETYEKLRSNKNITSKTVRELDYLARVIGSEIAIEETVTDSEGVSVNAKYGNGRITVAMDADDPLTVAVVHEAVHSIKESDEEAFRDLAGAVFNILANESDSFAQDFRNKARQYGWVDENGVYTENGEADTLEELVAQGMGIVAQNSDVLSRVTAQERSVIQRVLDAINDLVERIRGFTDYDAEKGISREDAETYKALLGHMEMLQGKLEAALTDKSDSIEAKAAEMVGSETETEKTPVSPEEEVKHSKKHDEALMDDADNYNDERGSVAKAVMEKAREQREFVKRLLSNESIQAMLPEDVEGNTVYSNSSYAKSVENSTVCPRSLVLDELANAVSMALGRPLSFNEALYVTQMSANYTDKPECAYCYVAADRKMYTDMLGRYIQQRNAAVQAHKEGESLDWIIENVMGIKPGDTKRNTNKMKDRVKTWLKMADEGAAFISEADLAGFGNFAEDIQKRRAILAPELRAEFDLATKYAQSAARAKLRVKYAAYDGKILKMSQKAVNNLNSMYGLRMYSFTDFSPAFILENMQMFTDAAVKGLKVLAYTKEMEFAEIFASTGANINISIHGMKSPDAQGEFHMDGMQGGDWERARALREQHPNVGITFVAESDAAVEWAMRQDWIDVVIPFHSVFGGGNLAAEIYGWKNYKQFQEDKKDSSLWKKGNAKSIYPAEHNNDLITYADALIKNGLTPRFPQWCNGFEQYKEGEIDEDTFRLLNPNYMKLVNECRRSAKDTPAVQPIFDTTIAEEAIDTMVKRGGFYEQIGGSSENMQEIAGEIAGEIQQGKAEEMAANKRLEKWSRKAVTPEELPTADTKYSLREIEQTAVDHFGTTTDFNEAGFILSNGEMLKFTDDNHRGERNYDHRAIGKAYGVDVDLSVNRGYNRESNRHLDDFVEKGGIRFDPGSLEFDFDATMQMSKTVAPTAEQERAIRDFIEWKKRREEQYNPDDDPLSLFRGALALRIDFGGTSDVAISADRGELGIKHLTYEGGQINADRIIADIRHYYKTGETRKPSVVAQFRYSRSNSDGRQFIRPIASEYLGDSDYAVIKYLGASVSLKQNKRGEWVGMFMGGGKNGNVIAETREEALAELDAKMSEAYASAYETPTDADRAEQAAWEGRETDPDTTPMLEGRVLTKEEATEKAIREGYPTLLDDKGREVLAIPEYTWVRAHDRGNYGLVVNKAIGPGGLPAVVVYFEEKGTHNNKTIVFAASEVTAVEGEMNLGKPAYTDEDAPPEVDNTPPPDMWLPSEEEYQRQRELQESREESKREYQRMTADELTQQIIEQTPRQQRPESGVDISKIDVKEKQRQDAERIQRRREQAARVANRSAFTGTDEMKAAGIKVSGSLVRNWANIQQLMQRNQAEKSVDREYGRMLKKYNLRPGSPEVQFAKGIANGTYSEEDIPKRFNAGIVKDIANMERVRSRMKLETLKDVKRDITEREREKAAIIFADSEKYRATPHGKVTKNFMNERTPERVLRSIYGADKGAQIFNYLFRPVQENNAEAIRWVNKQKEDVAMRFVDSKNVQRDLTNAEKAYAQHVREGEGFAWQAAELEGYDLETYDAHMANFKQLMQLMKRDGYSDVIELVDAVNRGDMSRSEAEDKAPNPELFREVLANRQAAISLPEMDSDLRKIVEGVQWYRQIEEEIKNNKEVDAVIIDNAADAIGEKYDDYYKIINQFLVAHGHDEIGFIPGYAPHMQPEPQRKALGQALATLGIQLDEVSSLPAAIAGRTADFKPNMRWNPHFQHRRGGETGYNIVKGFESYLKFMSDIIYHTDDIMRLRQAVNYFRTTYGSEEIAANLSAANAIRNASLEDKVSFLQGRTPEGYTPMFMSEANELIDRYVESQYEDAENLSKYSEFVTWLENYANMLAGKQSLADRGLEYSGGRLLLNTSRKVMNAFMRANVAGSLSSVLNQTAQLPMITTHLGPKYGAQAIRDIITGEIRKADWNKRSDFLMGKTGVRMLEKGKGMDRAVEILFTPAQMMDNVISTMAVRGEYLRQIDQGVSEEIAMRRADDYARRVMGSRVKGERPQGFESKRLFAQMAHVFQVEAANQFDYAASDLPQAIRDLAEREGKLKAAKKVAAVVTSYLLQAFLLNRLGEELYGGTPAPFDILGMASEFNAAGRDMSTERWLMQMVDNVMENHLGGERVFGTSEDEGAEVFDWANAMEALTYTASNDLPYVRNIAGILGLGDESLPTVGINEVWQGAKGLWSGAKGEDGRFGGGDADWREIGDSALDVAAQILPGGRQLKKTATGIGTMIEGGSYSGNKLRYPVDGSIGKWAQAILFGTSALDETDEYYATNARNLSEKQTFVYKALVADGMQRQDAYEALQRYREVDNDKTLTAAEKANAKRDFITALPISDEAKLETWLDLVLDGEESRKYETARNLMDMGVQWMHVAAALNEQATIDEGDGTAGDKATAFAKWIDDYADEHWLEEEAADVMKDGFAFWSMVKQEASTYEKLMDSGLSTSQAQNIYSLWANLKPEEGKKSVSEVQKMFALVTQKGMSDDQRYDATAGTLIDNTSMTTESGNPSQYAKMLWCQEAGLSYADYAEAKNANAIDNLYRFGTEAGADAESAYTMAMAVAALKPAPGKKEVSQGQKYEAIGRADVEDSYKLAVMEEWLSESAMARFEQAMGFGLTIEMYGKALQIVPKFDHNNNGYLSQAEYEAAIRSMSGLTNRERAALWQMLANGKNNPFDREVSKAMYKK